MSNDDTNDPRAKYRHLPPAIKPEDIYETVDTSSPSGDEVDENEGARPYLRNILGPNVG